MEKQPRNLFVIVGRWRVYEMIAEQTGEGLARAVSNGKRSSPLGALSFIAFCLFDRNATSNRRWCLEPGEVDQIAERLASVSQNHSKAKAVCREMRRKYAERSRELLSLMNVNRFIPHPPNTEKSDQDEQSMNLAARWFHAFVLKPLRLIQLDQAFARRLSSELKLGLDKFDVRATDDDATCELIAKADRAVLKAFGQTDALSADPSVLEAGRAEELKYRASQRNAGIAEAARSLLALVKELQLNPDLDPSAFSMPRAAESEQGSDDCDDRPIKLVGTNSHEHQAYFHEALKADGFQEEPKKLTVAQSRKKYEAGFARHYVGMQGKFYGLIEVAGLTFLVSLVAEYFRAMSRMTPRGVHGTEGSYTSLSGFFVAMLLCVVILLGLKFRLCDIERRVRFRYHLLFGLLALLLLMVWSPFIKWPAASVYATLALMGASIWTVSRYLKLVRSWQEPEAKSP